MTLMIFTIGFAADLSRGLAYRAELQTAADAAALAGMGTGEINVIVTARCYYWVQESDDYGNVWWELRHHDWRYNGPEYEFNDKAGTVHVIWRERYDEWADEQRERHSHFDHVTSPRVEDRWVEYPSASRDAAEAVFWRNAAHLAEIGNVSPPTVTLDGGRGRPGRVTVGGEFSFPTILLGAFGLDRLGFQQTAVAKTLFEQP